MTPTQPSNHRTSFPLLRLSTGVDYSMYGLQSDEYNFIRPEGISVHNSADYEVKRKQNNLSNSVDLLVVAEITAQLQPMSFY